MEDRFKSLCGAFADVFFHPIRTLRLVNEYNVRMFFNLCRMNGFRDAMFSTMDAIKSSGYVPDSSEDDFSGKEYGYSEEPLDVPCFEQPLVSIIIPVYNQFRLTYSCIKSIIGTVLDIPYEVIIADDCSTDETADAESRIRGAKVIHNPENLRFTLNCNNAVKSARGKYIMLLNNDTIVREQWLSSLVDLLDEDRSVGMAGSKFIFPDGRLQEAGGIVWADGSSWNYGRGKDPSRFEYNYLKDVDYISGASLLISRELWDEIGGFDVRFAPSYCEDTDLAFEVRRHGYRVVYHPFSEVVHFEGASNGKSSASGLKAYQVINKDKFFEKWKGVLDRENILNQGDVFHARDRSFGRPTVLIADAQIPRFDRDAGSRTADMYIRLLLKMGFNIKLIGANYAYEQDYVRRYQALGVEVLYGDDMRTGWKAWVLHNSPYLDYALLFHPQVAEVYAPFLKAHTHAKIVYNMCDLHYLRIQRQADYSSSARIATEAERMRERELRVMDMADVVLSVNYEETEIVNDSVPGDKAVTVPAYYYPDAPNRCRSSDTKNLMFVGGFGHTPNVDSIIWFVQEVWPLLSGRLSGHKLHIIGSNPTEDILSLASEDIIVEGQVSDEALSSFYDSCAVCIIPLQYGAGVKGKTVEAMYHGIPIVTTAVGTEGLPGVESILRPCDDSETFADEIVRICNEPEYAAALTAGFSEYVSREFSEGSVRKVFERVFS